MVAISDKEVEAESEGVAADVAEGDICPMPAAAGVAAAVVAIVPVAVIGPVC